ncbi:hypothetical protein [Okeania sp. SIO1I7]|nr:hypothetical protein [Okeania sp. SIO1I7]NET24793.1 hypothetical protein [Okeania sp. SIO1I7]
MKEELDGGMGRWGDGEMGSVGVWEKLKNIYPHHYYAGAGLTRREENLG